MTIRDFHGAGRRIHVLEEQMDPLRQSLPRIEQILRDIQRRLDRAERERPR